MQKDKLTTKAARKIAKGTTSQKAIGKAYAKARKSGDPEDAAPNRRSTGPSSTSNEFHRAV